MTAAIKKREGYTFDAFILDERERMLWRADETVGLSPKAFDMLLVLVRHAGEPLDKEQLMAQVWPDAFVEEANLAVHISMLRKVLGERPDGGHYIETLPRRGYRFAAEVHEFHDPVALSSARDAITPIATRSVAADTAADSSAPLPNGLPASRHFINYVSKRKSVAITVTIIIAVALAGVMYFAFRRKPTASGTMTIQKLAVLPFSNKGPGGQPNYFGLAIADSIINKLGLVSALMVSPTSYVEKYVNSDPDPRKVAEELDVSFLLMGTYIIDGDDVMVNAQLIDIAHEEPLWHESIKETSDKLTEIQDHVARQVVAGLRVQLSEREGERLSHTVPVDPRAYANFARSRYLMATNQHGEAIQLLDEAVRIDPNFALAWTYLARAYHLNALQVSGDRKELLQAEADYQQALDLDPDQPQTRLMFAKFLTETGRVEEAAPRLVALLADNPNLGEAHWELSYAYRYAGLLNESIAEGEHAAHLDSHLQSHQFNSYLYNGEYEKFLASLPLYETAYVMFYRGLSYYYLNDLQRADAAFDRAYKLNGESVISQIGRAMQLAIEGKKREGLTLLQGVEAKNIHTGIGDGEIAYKFAQAYDALGDDKAAMLSLKRALEQGFFCHPYFARDPLLKAIRNAPEFAVVLEKARQRHEAFRRKMISIGALPSQP